MQKRIFNILNNPDNYINQESLLRYHQKLSHKVAPFSRWDDRCFLEYKYFRFFQKKLNLNNPQTFNDKLQWIKLYDRNLLYTRMVDKYGVRNYVKEKIGEKYLNKLLGLYHDIEYFNWDAIPDQFIIKSTHGSGQNIIGHNKADFDFDQVKHTLSKWLQTNYYHISREWPYKHVEPRIVCEEYIPWDPQLGLLDYKIYCFQGKPTFIDVHYGRYSEHKSIFYDTNWIRQPFGLIPKETELDFIKPKKLEEMIYVAATLSENIPFCRVDLYYVDDKIYFGEITFFPGGGFLPFQPLKYNNVIGSMIQLPKKRIR